MLYAYLALCFAVHLHYVICVVAQMCQHLKIDCFSIKPKKADDVNADATQRLIDGHDLDLADDEI